MSTYGIAPDTTDHKRENRELSLQVLYIRKEIADFVKEIAHCCQFKKMGLINTSQAALTEILYLSEMRRKEKSEDTFIFKAVRKEVFIS